jgi:cytochrome c-type biogenesis protein CcmH
LKGNGLTGPLVITASLRGDELSGDTVKPFALEGRSDGNTNAGLSNANILIKKRTPIKLPLRAKQTATGPQKAAQTPTSSAGASSGAARKTISGSISVSPTLGGPPQGGVIFIVVRLAGAAAGPPLAVKRVANKGFPLRYEVSESNVMMAGMPFQGQVNVTVRLDGDGQVGRRPGDLEGRTKTSVEVGKGEVDIVLDKRY